MVQLNGNWILSLVVNICDWLHIADRKQKYTRIYPNITDHSLIVSLSFFASRNNSSNAKDVYQLEKFTRQWCFVVSYTESPLPALSESSCCSGSTVQKWCKLWWRTNNSRKIQLCDCFFRSEIVALEKRNRKECECISGEKLTFLREKNFHSQETADCRAVRSCRVNWSTVHIASYGENV